MDDQGRSKLLKKENNELKSQVFTALANHLQRIKYILPEAKVKALQKLPIWLDHHYEPLGSMQYHPGVTWLRANRHDPRLVKHVHIPRAKALLEPRPMGQAPVRDPARVGARLSRPGTEQRF